MLIVIIEKIDTVLLLKNKYYSKSYTLKGERKLNLIDNDLNSPTIFGNIFKFQYLFTKLFQNHVATKIETLFQAS